MVQRLRIGIVGTGMTANIIAQAIVDSAMADLSAIASCHLEIAQTFANKYGAAHAFNSWEKMLAWDGIDAVYVAVPTAAKEAICVAAAHAGKHVLADKPFADLDSLECITITCQVNKVAFMDATHFVHHPRTQHIHTHAQDKIGIAQAVRTSFFFPPVNDHSNLCFTPEVEHTDALGDMAWYAMRAVVEFLPDTPLRTVETFIQRDDKTDNIIRAAGILTFENDSTSAWDICYNADVCNVDLDILGTTGIISLDDFVLDGAKESAAGNPEDTVGYIVRNRIASPSNFQFVSTPSAKTQQALMIEDFVALVHSGYDNEEYKASIDSSRKTQALLDAVWNKVN
ncbi:MAG: Gfo/Idh/MocA family oxidoreductase [Cyanobacteria bacterium P01_H01_bin.21]